MQEMWISSPLYQKLHTLCLLWLMPRCGSEIFVETQTQDIFLTCLEKAAKITWHYFIVYWRWPIYNVCFFILAATPDNTHLHMLTFWWEWGDTCIDEIHNVSAFLYCANTWLYSIHLRELCKHPLQVQTGLHKFVMKFAGHVLVWRYVLSFDTLVCR